MLVDPDECAVDEDIFEIGSALKTRSQTPFCADRQKRIYAVSHLPNASGRSRHGEPVRAIHRTASIKSRLSRPGAAGVTNFTRQLMSSVAQSGIESYVCLRNRGILVGG